MDRSRPLTMAESAQVVEANEALTALNNVEWSFDPGPVVPDSELQPFNARKHHWYPATFVPEIPFSLIEILTSPGARVYDPYGGIGTTYFQALSLNRRPLSTEICTVATNYVRNLFHLFDPVDELDVIFSNIDSELTNYSQGTDYVTDLPDFVLVDEIDPWYHEDDFNELSFLYLLADEIDDRRTEAAIKAVFSAILATQSGQDRGWGCIADNMKPNKSQIEYKGTISTFRKKLKHLLNEINDNVRIKGRSYAELYEGLSAELTALNSDVRECELIQPNSVDLIVTSPPYPEMTDYSTSQRLSYYWLGERVGLSVGNDDVNNEIGARRKRSRTNSIPNYIEAMKEANEVILSTLKPGGYLCNVLPVISDDDDARKEAIQIVLEHIESRDGVEKVNEYKRVIPANRRAHNIEWTALDEEKITLFQKEEEEE